MEKKINPINTGKEFPIQDNNPEHKILTPGEPPINISGNSEWDKNPGTGKKEIPKQGDVQSPNGQNEDPEKTPEKQQNTGGVTTPVDTATPGSEKSSAKPSTDGTK